MRVWVARLAGRLARLAGAAACCGVGGLLLWVVGALLVLPIDDATPLQATALRGFMVCTVGGIGVGALWAGFRLLVGLPGASRPPRALRRLCAGCGRQGDPGGTCAGCGLDRQPRPARWAPLVASPWGEVLVALILVGLGFLGLFMLTYAVQGGEPLLLRAFSVLLGLLMMLVGAVGGLGVVELLRAKSKNRGSYRYFDFTAHPGATRTVKAEARVAGGKVVAASGTSTWIEQPAARPAGDRPDLGPAELLTARLLGALSRDEQLTWSLHREDRWDLADGAQAEPGPGADAVSYREAPRQTRQAGGQTLLRLQGSDEEEEPEDDAQESERRGLLWGVVLGHPSGEALAGELQASEGSRQQGARLLALTQQRLGEEPEPAGSCRLGPAEATVAAWLWPG